MDYEALGHRIREYRTKIKMTQETLAESIDLSAVYISQIETGSRKPSLETVFNISRTLNVSMDDLFKDSITNDKGERLRSIESMLNGRQDNEIELVESTIREMLKHIKDGKIN